MGARRPDWWCYPEQCANGHEWAPGLITVSFARCDCAPVQAAFPDRRARGHLAVACRVPGCGSVWYSPRHDPGPLPTRGRYGRPSTRPIVIRAGSHSCSFSCSSPASSTVHGDTRRTVTCTGGRWWTCGNAGQRTLNPRFPAQAEASYSLGAMPGCHTEHVISDYGVAAPVIPYCAAWQKECHMRFLASQRVGPSVIWRLSSATCAATVRAASTRLSVASA